MTKGGNKGDKRNKKCDERGQGPCPNNNPWKGNKWDRRDWSPSDRYGQKNKKQDKPDQQQAEKPTETDKAKNADNK